MLYVVGSGIRFGQLTLEARGAIQSADECFYVVADELAEEQIRRLREANGKPLAHNLYGLYEDGKERMVTYGEMIEAVLAPLRAGKSVCFVAYGHPGSFAYPTRESIRRARKEGYHAEMFPGISAFDCLMADLLLDPAEAGCMQLEATHFLHRRQVIEPRSGLVLWQIGVLGARDFQSEGYDLSRMPELVELLCQYYPPDHPCCIYEAAIFPASPPRMDWTTIVGLPEANISAISTLWIPPLKSL